MSLLIFWQNDAGPPPPVVEKTVIGAGRYGSPLQVARGAKGVAEPRYKLPSVRRFKAPPVRRFKP